MTNAQMLSLLGMYLGDTKNNPFTRSRKYILLNIAQERLLEVAKRHILNELNILEPSDGTHLVADENGSYDLTDLSNTIFQNDSGIDGIKLITGTGAENGYFCYKISFLEYVKYVNENHQWSNRTPDYYIRGTRIYLLPANTSDIPSGEISAGETYYVGGYTSVRYNGIAYDPGDTFLGVTGVRDYDAVGTGTIVVATQFDIYYRKNPADMSISQECQLDSNMHKILVGLACENYTDNTASASRAYQQSISAIAELNKSYAPTDSITYNLRRFDQEYQEQDSGLVFDVTFQTSSTTGGDVSVSATISAAMANSSMDAYIAVYSDDDSVSIGSDVTRASAEIYGIINMAVTNGNFVNVVTWGPIENSAWAWTPQLPIFLNGITGQLSHTPPAAGSNKWICNVGFALSATEIFVRPDREGVTQAI